jgi:hypothetical protein
MKARHEHLEIMEIIAAKLQNAGFNLAWGSQLWMLTGDPFALWKRVATKSALSCAPMMY